MGALPTAGATVLLLVCLQWPGARGAETSIKLGEVVSAFVEADRFRHYSVQIPPSSPAVKVIISPLFGDPDLFLSFSEREPVDTTATWVLDEMGTEERLLRRSAAQFCSEEPCVLHMSVYGYESAQFKLGVYNASDLAAADDAAAECASGCKALDLSDGICDQDCNTTACFFDGGDCLVERRSRSTCDWKTRAGCPISWLGDGVCDEECFVEECDFDGNDCALLPTRDALAADTEGGGAAVAGAQARSRAAATSRALCRPGCMASWVNDGECDRECNHRQCGYDGGDCFHQASECYHAANGSDYRGQISVTASGLKCQSWAEQFPHQHTSTHTNHPHAGLGGHSFCRNPAGREVKPWCYTADPAARWEYCALPAPFSSCMPNELPLAVRAAQAKPPCLIEGPNPSGPLALFRKACGRTGANSTFGEICSRACCNAAADAARSCRADAKHRDAYASYVMDVQWTMLQRGCTSCKTYATFFENAHTLDALGGAHVASLLSGRRLAALLVAAVLVLSLMCVVVCVLVRHVHERRNYALQTCDIEDDGTDEDDDDYEEGEEEEEEEEVDGGDEEPTPEDGSVPLRRRL